jgi:hypothetical protein
LGSSSSRRRDNAARLAPDARDRQALVRRRMRAAARRGDTEIVVPGVSGAIDQALCAEGFSVTPVASEDGPYAVVAW